MAIFALVWLICSAAYVLFAGQFSADELLAALCVGLVGALWSAALRRIATVHLRFERRALGAIGRAIAGLPRATITVGARLAAALVGRRSGETSAQIFIHGARTDPADVGRRAVGVLACSLAPDSFVVRTPDGQDAIEVHRLVKTSNAPDARWAV